MEKLTIMTSVYNSKDYIDGFMENTVKQRKFDDCILLLLNCNSVDNYEGEVIDKYCEKFTNIVHYRHGTPTGDGKNRASLSVYGAWNFMIQKVTTPYLMNANTDDRFITVDFLKTAIEYLDENQDIDLIYGPNIVIDSFENLKRFDQDDSSLWGMPLAVWPSAQYSPQTMLSMNLPHCRPVWRASLHNRFGLFDETYQSAADWDFWIRCAFGHTDSGRVSPAKMEAYSNVVGLYYNNPTGVSTAFENMPRNLAEVNAVAKKWKGIYQ
jgi:glycosyltransferase involved in cell wall biosynthesis